MVGVRSPPQEVHKHAKAHGKAMRTTAKIEGVGYSGSRTSLMTCLCEECSCQGNGATGEPLEGSRPFLKWSFGAKKEWGFARACGWVRGLGRREEARSIRITFDSLRHHTT